MAHFNGAGDLYDDSTGTVPFSVLKRHPSAYRAFVPYRTGSVPELLVLDRSVLPTQVQIGALLLLLRLLWLPDLSERLQVYCVLLWLLCSAVLERQKRSRFEFRVVDHF
eukprot:COSAG03_NODE_551_length_6981_cov_20.070038_8_plen_109_part_00